MQKGFSDKLYTSAETFFLNRSCYNPINHHLEEIGRETSGRNRSFEPHHRHQQF
jgi:hypothetical protein